MAAQAALSPDVLVYPTKKLFTVDEYYELAEKRILRPDERTELIEGEIIVMAPIGCYHNSTVLKLNQIFSSLINAKAVVSVQSPVRISGVTEPEPDIMLLRPKENFYADAHPTQDDVYLIVEVSETTLNYDLNTKLPIYAKANVPEVCIVNNENDILEKYTNPSGDRYQTKTVLKEDDTIYVDQFSDIKIEINKILRDKSVKKKEKI